MPASLRTDTLPADLVVRRRAGAGEGLGAAASGGVRARTAAGGAPMRVVMFGALSPPTLAFARTCARNGIEAFLLERIQPGARPSGRSAALAGKGAFPAPLTGTEEGIAAIKAYCEGLGARALITVAEGDLLWLARNRARLEPAIRLLAAPERCLARLRSKADQIALARQSGFEVLPTWPLASVADAASIPEDRFPVCLRPADPGLIAPSFKAETHLSRAAVAAALGRLARFDGPILAQPFLEAPNLNVHGARSEAGEILAMRPFLGERKYEGLTLAMRPAGFPPGLEDCCRRLAEAAGIVGAFHFDLLFDPARGRAWFLEVNVRMGGSTDKVKAFGHDEPALIMDCFGLGHGAWRPAAATHRARVVTKRGVLKHMLHVMAKGPSELDYPRASRARHLLLSARDLVTARDSVFDWADFAGTAWFNLQRP